MKKMKRKVALLIILLYLVPWLPAHIGLHNWMDMKVNFHGTFYNWSVPVLPCVLLCWSDYRAGMESRAGIGFYAWYGFDVRCIWELVLFTA